MSADIIVIFIFCLFGLAAHAARQHGWVEWTLRVIIGFSFIAELFTIMVFYPAHSDITTPWSMCVTWVMAVLTGGMLFKPVRKAISYGLTVPNQILNGQVFLGLIHRQKPAPLLIADRIFVADSIPHMNALWVYVTVLGSLLANINPESMKVPSISLPFPVPIDSLFSYNFLGLIILSACGVGIIVTRKPKEVLDRLGLVKPTGKQVLIGIVFIFITAFYDYLWSLYTGTPSSGVGGKLANYNAGTFAAPGGGAGNAAFLALCTGVFAGCGEEILIRGALLPVFGAFPSGLLHGALHGQFGHAPILILQITGWSTMMGIVRYYTNTTTTIITHVGYNLIFTFLFAFNP